MKKNYDFNVSFQFRSNKYCILLDNLISEQDEIDTLYILYLHHVQQYIVHVSPLPVSLSNSVLASSANTSIGLKYRSSLCSIIQDSFQDLSKTYFTVGH